MFVTPCARKTGVSSEGPLQRGGRVYWAGRFPLQTRAKLRSTQPDLTPRMIFVTSTLSYVPHDNYVGGVNYTYTCARYLRKPDTAQ